MKKFALIVTLLFVFTFLPFGVMADETQDQTAIPNNTIEVADTQGAPIPNLTEMTEDENLNPVERTIVIRDTIRSNASTGINSGN